MKGDVSAVTIDSSVWVASVIASEPAHHECAAVVQRVISQEVTMVQPTLFLVEVAAALGRRFRGETHAENVIDRVRRLSTMREVPLDALLAARATHYAMRCGLRGADAVYLATATRAQTTFVTLDREVRERALADARVVTPMEWLRGT